MLAPAMRLLGAVCPAVLIFLAAACVDPPPPPQFRDAAAEETPDAGTIRPRDAGPPPHDAGVITGLVDIEIRISPSEYLARSATASASATGIMSNGDRIDLTRAATWHTSSSTTVRVLAGGQLIAEGNGFADVWATRGEIESVKVGVWVGVQPPANLGELRGVWVTRWTYSSVEDVQRIVDELAAANFNAIFLQVRGNADAYYASSLEPWAKRLSGTLGQDPGWDPLAEMITRAHAKGLQVHAWMNTFPAWSGTELPTESTIRHPLLAHPEWLCADQNGTPMAPAASDYQFFSPGNPEVRAHVANVALEIASNYDVDGLHFDYVRYPGRVYCHDAVSEAEFARERMMTPELTWEDFQRSRVTLLLQDVRTRLRTVKPAAIMTVASWPIYQNKWGWSSVSLGYNDYYQDAHRWAKEGIVDALCPMTYWRMTQPSGARTDWLTLVEDHLAAAEEGGRYVFAAVSGQHDADELLAQIEYARSLGARGLMFFDLSYLRANDHLARLAAGPFAEPAVIPSYPWR